MRKKCSVFVCQANTASLQNQFYYDLGFFMLMSAMTLLLLQQSYRSALAGVSVSALIVFYMMRNILDLCIKDLLTIRKRSWMKAIVSSFFLESTLTLSTASKKSLQCSRLSYLYLSLYLIRISLYKVTFDSPPLIAFYFMEVPRQNWREDGIVHLILKQLRRDKRNSSFEESSLKLSMRYLAEW